MNCGKIFVSFGILYPVEMRFENVFVKMFLEKILQKHFFCQNSVEDPLLFFHICSQISDQVYLGVSKDISMIIVADFFSNVSKVGCTTMINTRFQR